MASALQRPQAVLLTLLLATMCGCGGGGGTPGVAGSVSGVVISAAGGESVEGATVTIVTTVANTSLHAPQTTTTDNQGEYVLPNVPPGTAHMRVDAANGAFEPVEFDITIPTKDGLQVSPRLLPVGVTPPSAIVVHPSSAPLAVGEMLQLTTEVEGANLYPFYYVTGNIGLVDYFGRFTATNPGTGTVVAQIGAITAKATITVSGQAPVGTVVVFIHDEQGKPSAGVGVGWDGGSIYNYTDCNGQFIIGGLTPGEHQILATKPGYDDIRVDAQIPEGQVVTMSETLRVARLENLTMTPSSVSLGPGAGQKFVVTSDNVAEPAVAFSIQEDGGGSFAWSWANFANYVAPDKGGSYHVVAVSVSDPTQKVVATITVKTGNGEVIID